MAASACSPATAPNAICSTQGSTERSSGQFTGKSVARRSSHYPLVPWGKIAGVTEASRVRLSNEVRDALDRGAAVVALESTIVTHGLPRPRNLELAQRLESVVREEGGVPATVGVVGGDLVVGLSAEELERLASGGADKASIWNLGALVAKGADAGTTVATTLLAAHEAGISVFATGGIGGVHRNHAHGEASFDVSADLYELARTPVCVVSSGAKSILDLPRTLEMLESLGVPVVGYGTRSFPTFYSRDAGLPLHSGVDTAEEAARLLQLHNQLDLGGLLLANPVPEAAAIPSAEVEGWLAEALKAAEQEGISGAGVTPFLLAHLHWRSDGRTLDANRALLVANARLAAEVAAALARQA